jgi:hypothetical protein
MLQSSTYFNEEIQYKPVKFSKIFLCFPDAVFIVKCCHLKWNLIYSNVPNCPAFGLTQGFSNFFEPRPFLNICKIYATLKCHKLQQI